MSPFDYILPLVSVLVGLAIADLAVSLHRLLRARDRVQWDWLPLATALLAVLAVLEVWWVFYHAQGETFFTTLGGFLPFAAQLVLLFLLNAAALPDEVPPDGLDLNTFYASNSPYYWSLYATYAAFVVLARIVTSVLGPTGNEGGLVQVILTLIPNVVLLALFGTLVVVQKRWLHTVAVVLMVTLLLVEWSDLSLGTG